MIHQHIEGRNYNTGRIAVDGRHDLITAEFQILPNKAHRVNQEGFSVEGGDQIQRSAAEMVEHMAECRAVIHSVTPLCGAVVENGDCISAFLFRLYGKMPCDQSLASSP